ncbi:MAG: hypothetical protein N3A02_05660, partial [Rectinema sp.]|nr:hypothetical protein [Rectinema sp.]
TIENGAGGGSIASRIWRTLSWFIIDAHIIRRAETAQSGQCNTERSTSPWMVLVLRAYPELIA